MQYKRFGNSGIEVSRLCLGCMDFPMRLPLDQAQRVFDTAIDNGVNFLDTADAYGDGKRGQSEEILSNIIKQKRDKIILATKCWVQMDKENRNSRGTSRYHIIRAVEGSLNRLKTDHIDLYQFHHPDERTPLEESISALDNLVKQGKIRYAGVSNHYAWQILEMLTVSRDNHWVPIISNQCRYNIMDRAVENELVPFAKKFNIALMTYGPLNGGFLTGKYKRGEKPPAGSRMETLSRFEKILTDKNFDLLDQLRPIAEKYALKLNQLAYCWLLSKDYITAPIMGGSKPEHFEQIYEAADKRIEQEDVRKIDELSDRFKYIPFWNQPVKMGSPLLKKP
jgi:aryl-alcohol dehydrogenase-like predicted oxidoreductase